MKEDKGDDLTPKKGEAETQEAEGNESPNAETNEGPEKIKIEEKKEEKLTHAEQAAKYVSFKTDSDAHLFTVNSNRIQPPNPCFS